MAYVIDNPNDYVLSDLNVRLDYVSPQDSTVITDRETALQSIYRLLETEEGEIPNYRNYGLNLKQFVHRPLNRDLVETVTSYLKGKILMYVADVSIKEVRTRADYANGYIILNFVLIIQSTQEVIEVQPISVYVG